MAANRWNSFGEAVEACRRRASLSQKELADRAHVGYSTVKAYEGNSDRAPNQSAVRSLADVLGLEGDERDEFIALSQRKRRAKVVRKVALEGDECDERSESVALTLSKNQSDIAEADALALSDADITAPMVADDLEPSQFLDDRQDRQAQAPSDATPHSAHRAHVATLQEFLTVLYNHYRGRLGKLLTFAISLLATVGLVILSLTAVIYWRTDRYESVVTYTNDEVLCAGGTDLCQTVSASVQGHVHMVCWQDAISFGGTKNRWFYIQAPDGSEGFVHASAISQQIITPYCSKISWMNATAWALNQDGQMAIQPNAKSGNDVTYWSSSSWLFAYDAWKLGGGHTPVHSAATAQQTWEMYKANGAWHAASNMPPRGSLVFFADGSIGCVGVSLGNGWVEMAQGTDEAQLLPVTHMTIAQVGLTQVGYVPPILV